MTKLGITLCDCACHDTGALSCSKCSGNKEHAPKPEPKEKRVKVEKPVKAPRTRASDRMLALLQEESPDAVNTYRLAELTSIGEGSRDEVNLVAVHIRTLRKNLPADMRIEAIRGIGYKLVYV